MGSNSGRGVVQGIAAVASTRAEPNAFHQVQRFAHHLRVRHKGQGRACQGKYKYY